MPISLFLKNLWLVQTVIVTLASAAFAGQAKVYVANEDESTITVVDAATFKTVANIPLGQKPHNVQVGPDGKVA